MPRRDAGIRFALRLYFRGFCETARSGIRLEPRSHLARLRNCSRAGGSNASRSRLWKVGVQRLADLSGLHIHVSHFPPGTSKWNKIEHRMFSFISKNWRGRPLVSYQTIVDLIANTRTTTGLKIKAKLTRRTYPSGMKIPASQMAELNLKPAAFHGDWNYSLSPQ